MRKYSNYFDFVSVNKKKLEYLGQKKTDMILPDAHSRVTRRGDKKSVSKKYSKVNIKKDF